VFTEDSFNVNDWTQALYLNLGLFLKWKVFHYFFHLFWFKQLLLQNEINYIRMAEKRLFEQVSIFFEWNNKLLMLKYLEAEYLVNFYDFFQFSGQFFSFPNTSKICVEI